MRKKRDWMAQRRKELGISQKELAEKSGLSRSTVAGIEIGHRSGGPSIAKIARVLDVDMMLFYAE